MEAKEEPNMPYAIKISHEDFHVSELFSFQVDELNTDERAEATALDIDVLCLFTANGTT